MAGVVAVAVFGAGLIGYELGQRAGEAVGRADGYETAVDEKAAASWANTPTGQLALALDRAGSLATLARCANQGWKVEQQPAGRVCLPYRAPDAQYGWLLP
jgi:hypothetical protein